jgi:hypothetical protein
VKWFSCKLPGVKYDIINLGPFINKDTHATTHQLGYTWVAVAQIKLVARIGLR